MHLNSTGFASSSRITQTRFARVPILFRRGGEQVARASKSNPGFEGDEGVPDLIPLAGAETDWRQFRAQLASGKNSGGKSWDVGGVLEEGSDDRLTSGRNGSESNEAWVHPIGALESGCLLLAHPLMFTSQQTYFSQSVILIFTHNDKGTAGLLLNRPTGFKMGDVSGAEFLCPEFEDNLLYLGGDVGKSTLHLVHGFGEMKGCREVVNGVYMGGFDDALAAVKEGTHKASEFKWYGRYCGWAPGQLLNEISAGVWFTAAASPKVILEHRKADDVAADVWHEILQKMGGDYEELSKAVQETYKRNIVGENEDDSDERN